MRRPAPALGRRRAFTRGIHYRVTTQSNDDERVAAPPRRSQTDDRGREPGSSLRTGPRLHRLPDEPAPLRGARRLPRRVADQPVGRRRGDPGRDPGRPVGARTGSPTRNSSRPRPPRRDLSPLHDRIRVQPTRHREPPVLRDRDRRGGGSLDRRIPHDGRSGVPDHCGPLRRHGPDGHEHRDHRERPQGARPARDPCRESDRRGGGDRRRPGTPRPRGHDGHDSGVHLASCPCREPRLGRSLHRHGTPRRGEDGLAPARVARQTSRSRSSTPSSSSSPRSRSPSCTRWSPN